MAIFSFVNPISCSATALYLLVQFNVLTVTFLILRKFKKRLWSFLLVELLYGSAAGAFAIWCAHDLFHMLQLLSYGCFVGGLIFLILCGYFSKGNFKALSTMYLFLAFLTLIIGVDAFVVEPHSVEVSQYKLVSPKITKPTRLAIVADLQTDNVGDYEKDVLKKVVDARPDLVLFAGDYVQCWTIDEVMKQQNKLKQTLHSVGLKPPGGIYAVPGDCESITWPAMFEDLKAKSFTKTETVVAGDLELTGLTLADSAKTDLRIAPDPVSRYRIVLGHRPDFALSKVKADLFIAGHTHGGQVQIPFFGPVVTMSAVPRKWAGGGLWHIDGDRNLIVSRGIGMERNFAPRLRFNCRPELVIVDLSGSGAHWKR